MIELVAADVEAYRALWQFVFDVDLVGVIEADLRPADELLSVLLAEPLRLRLRGGEPFYLRLTQLDVSLGVRRYAAEGGLVLQVLDPVCDWNAGRWRLEASGDGASCTRTDDKPDLTLDTRELATAYLERSASGAWPWLGWSPSTRPERSAAPTRCFAPTRCRGPRSTSDARVCHHVVGTGRTRRAADQATRRVGHIIVTNPSSWGAADLSATHRGGRWQAVGERRLPRFTVVTAGPLIPRACVVGIGSGR